MSASLSRILIATESQLKTKQNEVALFAGINNNTFVRVNITLHEILHVKCLIGTGAGPVLADRSFLHPTWTLRAESLSFLKLRSADKHSPISEGEILQQLQIGDLRIGVWYGFAETMQ